MNGFGKDFGDGLPVDPLSVSWGLFSATGNPGYYMLYADLLDLQGGDRGGDRLE